MVTSSDFETYIYLNAGEEHHFVWDNEIKGNFFFKESCYNESKNELLAGIFELLQGAWWLIFVLVDITIISKLSAPSCYSNADVQDVNFLLWHQLVIFTKLIFVLVGISWWSIMLALWNSEREYYLFDPATVLFIEMMKSPRKLLCKSI